MRAGRVWPKSLCFKGLQRQPYNYCPNGSTADKHGKPNANKPDRVGDFFVAHVVGVGEVLPSPV